MPKNKICSVRKCNEIAIKTVSTANLDGVKLDIEIAGRKIYLCRKHYKEYKKQRRKIEKLERWRWKQF